MFEVTASKIARGGWVEIFCFESFLKINLFRSLLEWLSTGTPMARATEELQPNNSAPHNSIRKSMRFMSKHEAWTVMWIMNCYVKKHVFPDKFFNFKKLFFWIKILLIDRKNIFYFDKSIWREQMNPLKAH